MFNKKNTKKPRNSPSTQRNGAPLEYKKKPVYSYRSSRKESSRRFNRGESDNESSSFSKFLLKSTKVSVALVVLVGILYFQSLSSDAKIKVVGDKVVLRPDGSYTQALKDELKSSKSNLSKITFNAQKISDDIKDQFPEIDSVKISLPLFQHQSTIEVTLAKPVARLVTSEKTYILDGQGRALFAEADASDTFNSEGLITVNDSSGHEINPGKPALTSRQINFIKELRDQSSNKNLNFESLSLSSGGSSLAVKFKEDNYRVKFSFLADPRQSSGAYFAIRDQLGRDDTKVSEYVDVRIPERAYVK